MLSLSNLVTFKQHESKQCGLELSRCVGEAQHLGQINIQQQLCLDFSKLIIVCSLFI